jgi:hypothetical protein
MSTPIKAETLVTAGKPATEWTPTKAGTPETAGTSATTGALETVCNKITARVTATAGTPEPAGHKHQLLAVTIAHLQPLSFKEIHKKPLKW